jgi:hypothetical protein
MHCYGHMENLSITIAVQVACKMFYVVPPSVWGRESSVGMVTRYKLDGPGIESRCGDEMFHTRPDTPWDPTSFLCRGYGVFPVGKAAGAWR